MTTPAPREWQRADYLVSTDAALLDLDAIHAAKVVVRISGAAMIVIALGLLAEQALK